MDIDDLEVRFNPSPNDLNAWAKRIRLEKPDEHELQRMYARARRFLIDKRDDLISHHGWVSSSEGRNDGNMLFVLEKDVCSSYDVGFGFPTIRDALRLELPVRIADMLDTWEVDKWGKMFSDTNIFHPGTSCCFKDRPASLSDIFHFIQILVPGLLVVVDRKDKGGDGEAIVYRVLPDDKWMYQNKSFLSMVLGTARFTRLLEAAEDFRQDVYDCRHYDSDRSDSPSDLINVANGGPSYDDVCGTSAPYTSSDKELGYYDDWND
ncbi:hypothetical protein E1B28_010274 [Marasmius oreades]|uniref:Uncharacterized protein n=1 Tax=Marasmius oreades TaxID=181124 RepID=A0A9P7RXF0_9AGAR|nr:uncharacterized protein E1B28_010274 [Marasmius oreades]KAG7091223.1 hypothetical protein E1B28_010274 [Marasmius oreades]